MRKKVFLLFILTCAVGAYARAQNIITIAGTGTPGYNGDSIAATTAQLRTPTGVAVDAFGDIYIADVTRVRKVNSSTGIITTVAGTGVGGFNGDSIQATSAQLFTAGIALDSWGNIYIADWANQRVRKVTVATGIITTVAGNGTSGFSGDNGPATSAQLFYPYGVAADDSGNVYIGDFRNDRVRKVTAATGIITTIAGTSFGGYNGDNIPATSASLFRPNDVAVDASGNVFISDYQNQRIRKINYSTGMITTIAGTGTAGYNGDNMSAVLAQINYPVGIDVDASGNIFIAEYIGSRIRKIAAADSMISTLAGNGIQGYNGDNIAATSAQIDSAWGVVVDASGNIYIADTYNDRIRKILNTPTAATEPGETAENILLYPNPAANQFFISGFKQQEKTDIEIYNAHGEKILVQCRVAGEKNTGINLSDYPPGIYFVRIKSSSRMITGRIVLLK